MTSLSLLSSTEKTDHANSRACSRKKYEEEGKMIEKGLIITGSDAELLSNALSEVKTKAYEESEVSLDDTQALEALVTCFKTVQKEEQEREKYHSRLSPLHKRLVLGTLLGRSVGADNRTSESQQS